MEVQVPTSKNPSASRQRISVQATEQAHFTDINKVKHTNAPNRTADIHKLMIPISSEVPLEARRPQSRERMKRWRSEGAVLVLGVHLEEPHDGQPKDGEGGQLHRQRAPPDDAGVLQDRRDGDAAHDRRACQEFGEVHPPACSGEIASEKKLQELSLPI